MRGKKERIEAKVKQLLEEHEQEDKGDDDPLGPGAFPSRDREKQIKRLHQQAKRIDRWLQDNEAKYGAQGKENASNITDNDSAKMQTSHGLIQGYNSQALIDSKHQVIVHAEAFGRGQDHEHAEPMMTGAKENMQARVKITSVERSWWRIPTTTARLI